MTMTPLAKSLFWVAVATVPLPQQHLNDASTLSASPAVMMAEAFVHNSPVTRAQTSSSSSLFLQSPQQNNKKRSTPPTASSTSSSSSSELQVGTGAVDPEDVLPLASSSSSITPEGLGFSSPVSRILKLTTQGDFYRALSTDLVTEVMDGITSADSATDAALVFSTDDKLVGVFTETDYIKVRRTPNKRKSKMYCDAMVCFD